MLFEKASRIKLSFKTAKGVFCVDDLWDLPLTSTTGQVNLDDLAKGLFKQLKDADEVASFVDATKTADPTLQLRFDIVKRVIDVKKAERQTAAEAKAKAEKQQQIMGLIAQKEFDSLSSGSIEDLKKQLAELAGL